jgi:hypothetical protein
MSPFRALRKLDVRRERIVQPQSQMSNLLENASRMPGAGLNWLELDPHVGHVAFAADLFLAPARAVVLFSVGACVT